MKIVINRCWGGFAISKDAAKFMAGRGNKRAALELKQSTKQKFHGYGYVNGMDGGYDRTDPDLVAAVEKLGAKSSGEMANLEVVEIPDDIEWELEDYDGQESIHEKHRSW